MNEAQQELIDIGWIAGIIDGEGHLGIAKRYHYYVTHIGINNTTKDTIDRVISIYKKWGVGHCVVARSRGGNRRDDWEVVVESMPRVLRLIEVVGKHLVGKRLHVEIILKFIESRQKLPRWSTSIGSTDRAFSEYELSLVKQIRALNYRGAPQPAMELLPTGTQ